MTVNCVLRRHPQERMVDRLDREYIRTSGELTMHHLKIFLSRKLSFEPPERFQVSLFLYLNKNGSFLFIHLIFLSSNQIACNLRPLSYLKILTIMGESSVIVHEDKISLYDIKKSMADAEEETILHFRIAPTA